MAFFWTSMLRCCRKRRESSKNVNVSRGKSSQKCEDADIALVSSRMPKKKNVLRRFMSRLFDRKSEKNKTVLQEQNDFQITERKIDGKTLARQVSLDHIIDENPIMSIWSEVENILIDETKTGNVVIKHDLFGDADRREPFRLQVKFKLNHNEFAGDFEITKKLGEGAFANVWMCVNRWDGKKYAVKKLKSNYVDFMESSTWEDVFELTVANTVDKHPCLLAMDMVYHQPDTGCLHLVYELMQQSLNDCLKKNGPLPDSYVKPYMYQILEGLKYMHGIGLMHRDLKPHNILLGFRDRELKIGDFGISCWAATNNEVLLSEYVSTLYYRSPECLLTRGKYGKKMDIWAAGCVMYQMAVKGVYPLFFGSDEINQMQKIEEVLGRPDRRFLHRLDKYKSDIFYNRYLNHASSIATVTATGIQSVYPPYKPGFEVFNDMIVYDPMKRLSADRLLRKPYFQELKNSPHDNRIIEFEKNR